MLTVAFWASVLNLDGKTCSSSERPFGALYGLGFHLNPVTVSLFQILVGVY
jgi:hypothetical protein